MGRSRKGQWSIFMQSTAEGYRQRDLRIIFVPAILCIVIGGLLALYSFPPAGPVRAMGAQQPYAAPCKSSSSAVADKQSLLIVLLDRSDSMTEVDPQSYNTSVVQALADLWSGSMAVIPFSGDQAPILGPDQLSDPHQRADLKQKVERYPFEDMNRPLVTAMQQGLNLLQQEGYPAGSQVILITAGNPAGTGVNDTFSQEKIIESQLIGQYCQHAVPVNTFGLSIDTQNPNGQEASHLLFDIATGTAAEYLNLAPQALPTEVLSLYAQAAGLTFLQTMPFTIDSDAQQVSIVAFRSAARYHISLIGPDGKPVAEAVVRTAEKYYEVDVLGVNAPVIAGAYEVNVRGDPGAHVYALIKSSLQVQLVEPTRGMVAQTGSPVPLNARFLDGEKVLTPPPGQGQIIVHITLFVDGSLATGQSGKSVVVLNQQAGESLFSGLTNSYTQPGQLRFEVQGTYQGAQRTTQLFLNLFPPQQPHKFPPPPWYVPVLARMGSTYHIIINFLVTYGHSGVWALVLMLLCFIGYLLWRWNNRGRDGRTNRGELPREREKPDQMLEQQQQIHDEGEKEQGEQEEGSGE